MIFSWMDNLPTRLTLRWLALGLLGFLALLTISYTVAHTFSRAGSIDFHSYWYSGQFVRQGIDPYTSYIQARQPPTPVEYLDGPPTLQPPVGQPGLADVPANTAPMVLLLSLFSYFTWPTAKVLWMASNLAFMVLIPILLIRLLPGDQSFDFTFKAIIFLGFLGLFGVRNTAGNGQTGLFVMLLMLAAWLMASRNWLWAGIALGMALSKYSLGLPFFILFLLQKQYRLLAVALLFQAAGLLLLSLITNQPAVVIVQAQIQIFQIHAGLSGIHLGSLFQSPILSLISSISVSLIAIISIFIWFRKRSGRMGSRGIIHPSGIYGWHLASILVLWTLLVAYHRAYDTLLAAPVLALLLYGLAQGHIWAISRRQLSLLAVAGIAFYIVLTLPASSVAVLARWVSPELLAVWMNLHTVSITFALLGMLVIIVWLMTRIDPGKGNRRPVNSLKMEASILDKDLLWETSSCDGCGQLEAEPVFEGPDRLERLPGLFKVVRCLNCGLLRQNPRLKWKSLSQYYRRDYISHPRLVQDQASGWKRLDKRYGPWKRLRAVEQFQKGGSLLEVGCGTGNFLEEALRSGRWQVTGIEPGPQAARYVQEKLQVRVYNNLFHEVSLPENTFEVVAMWNVLEHMPEPVQAVQSAYKLLKKNGWLVLSIPNLESLEARLFGRYWVGWDLPRHLYFFPQLRLKSILRDSGFRWVDSRCLSTSYAMFGHSFEFWSQSWEGKRPWLRKAILSLYYSLPGRMGAAAPFWLLDRLRLSTILTVFAQKNVEQ
jgi:SAM-dependent methyltransferase